MVTEHLFTIPLTEICFIINVGCFCLLFSVYVFGDCVFSEVLEKRTANHLFWSPNGQFIVLAGLRR